MPSPDRPVARRPHSAPSGDTYLTSDTGKQYKEENQDCMKTIKKKKGIQKKRWHPSPTCRCPWGSVAWQPDQRSFPSLLRIRREIRLRSMIGHLANEAIILWQVTCAAEKSPERILSRWSTWFFQLPCNRLSGLTPFYNVTFLIVCPSLTANQFY